MSCQGAHQLRTHVDLLRELIGEPLEVHATPFDWLICPPAGVAAMIADGVTMPRDPSELQPRRKPYWPARSCYFWHVKGAITDHARALERAQDAEAWLEAVGTSRRRIFLLCNSQNNLEEQRREVGGFTIPFTQEAVDGLWAALVARFGPCELHVVTRPRKHALRPPRTSGSCRPIDRIGRATRRSGRRYCGRSFGRYSVASRLGRPLHPSLKTPECLAWRKRKGPG